MRVRDQEVQTTIHKIYKLQDILYRIGNIVNIL